MQERAHILQAQFLLRSLRLSDDALLTKLLPFLKQPNSHSQWCKLLKNALWQRCSDIVDFLDKKRFKQLRLEYLQANLNKRHSEANSRLLSACRYSVCLDPIHWLPISRPERSLCVRWRLYWLPDGKPKPCPKHPNQLFTKTHFAHCPNMHARLQIPRTAASPLSFLLNLLTTRKPRPFPRASSQFFRWPLICTILYELDHLFHGQDMPPPLPELGRRFL